VNFVLDTNALSETERPRPNPGFINCLDAQDPAHLFITTISVAEIWNGFYRLEPGHRDYNRVKIIATNLPRKCRVLSFDLRAAAIGGELTANASAPLPLRDSFIGAIARSRGYQVVTRDVAPFERMGCKVLNPWS
jgi:predicted nucleic acid-binding protein